MTVAARGIALVLAAGAAGCAMQRPPAPVLVSAQQPSTIGADWKREAIVIGKSTKRDVSTLLGDTLSIGFESGFEVWIYRIADEVRGKAAQSGRSALERQGPNASAEFVVLFAPSGTVAKTRFRPAPPRGG
jgi:hypothetical protein